MPRFSDPVPWRAPSPHALQTVSLRSALWGEESGHRHPLLDRPLPGVQPWAGRCAWSSGPLRLKWKISHRCDFHGCSGSREPCTQPFDVTANKMSFTLSQWQPHVVLGSQRSRKEAVSFLERHLISREPSVMPQASPPCCGRREHPPGRLAGLTPKPASRRTHRSPGGRERALLRADVPMAVSTRSSAWDTGPARLLRMRLQEHLLPSEPVLESLPGTPDLGNRTAFGPSHVCCQWEVWGPHGRP